MTFLHSAADHICVPAVQTVVYSAYSADLHRICIAFLNATFITPVNIHIRGLLKLNKHAHYEDRSHLIRR